jgi:hypothetical protein
MAVVKTDACPGPVADGETDACLDPVVDDETDACPEPDAAADVGDHASVGANEPVRSVTISGIRIANFIGARIELSHRLQGHLEQGGLEVCQTIWPCVSFLLTE